MYNQPEDEKSGLTRWAESHGMTPSQLFWRVTIGLALVIGGLAFYAGVKNDGWDFILRVFN